MPEEIKIKIASEYDGKGVQQAISDEEKLKKGETRWDATARQIENHRLFQDELKAKELRSQGHTSEAKAIEKKIDLTKRAHEIERQQGVTRGDALKLAEREASVLKAATSHGHHPSAGMMAAARGLGEFGDMATGGSGYVMRAQQLARLGSMMSNPYVAAAVVATAAVAAPLIVRGIKDSEHAKDQALADEMREKTRGSERERGHRAAFGNASESAAKARESADAIKELHEHEKTRFHEVHDSASARFLRTITFGFSDKWREQGFMGHKSAYAREKEHDAKEKERLKKEEEEDKKLAAEQFAKVESKRHAASHFANAGQFEVAEQQERDAQLEEERRKLKSYGKSDAEIDQMIVTKRKELEGAAAYQKFLRAGGQEDIDASKLRAQGKTAEADMAEAKAQWQKDYEHFRHEMGGETPSEEINKKARAAADVKKKEREEAAYEDWRQHGGRASLDALEARNRGDIRTARKLEDDARWWARYQEMSKQLDPSGQHLHDAEAIEQANAELFAEKKRRAGSYQHAIDARAGAGDAVRVASLAAREMGVSVSSSQPVVSALHAMHGTMRDAYIKSTEAAWRAKFPRSGSRP